MSAASIIETRDLSKSYGKVEAVRSLNLAVAPNRITGFLGRNGAGKSTTIKMLLGMIRPSGGDATVLGKAVADLSQSVELRRHVAYVSEDKRLYDYMTVEQIIRFTASFYSDWRSDAVGPLLRKWELPPARKIKSLSKGMRTKLALLLAFARRPALLILDEPSEGLDPVGIEQLLELLVAQSSEGATVFFSSHQIAEVERVADHVCIIDKGRLMVNSSLDDLRQFCRRIDAVFPSVPAEQAFQIPGVERIHARGSHLSLFATFNSEEVVKRARELHALSVDVAPVGLRDVFLETVKEGLTMLWYKAWLETRTRFLISLAGIAGLPCFFVYRQDRQALGWTKQKLSYYYFAFSNGHQTLAMLWVIAVVLLMMGGIVREKAVGSSSFTLALPVSRGRIMRTRIAMGVLESVALGVFAWGAMLATASVAGRPLALSETAPYLVLLFGAGASFFAVAVFAASLLEGEYTAPLVAYGVLVGLAIVLGDPSLRQFNLWRVLLGADLLDKSTFTLTGPLPWPQMAASWIVATLLLLVSIKIVERREF